MLMTEPLAVRTRHLAPALGLLFLAPVTAEYLYGYDDSTGNPGSLLGNLFLFTPLYGGAALFIREVARRASRGWPTILLLGLAFGVLQAGLIDQSMFSPAYRDISYWDEWFRAFDVPAVGMNPSLAIAFTVGHMIWSVAVPIAIIEALVPRHRATPWLGNIGLASIAVGFAAAAVVGYQLDTEVFRPNAGQIVGAAVVLIALAIAAFSAPRQVPPSTRPTVTPAQAGAAVFALLSANQLINVRAEHWLRSESWRFLLSGPGFAVHLIVLGTLGLLLARSSLRAGWGSSHHLAVAGGAILANAITAFTANPIGDVSDTAKYAHNTIGLLAVVIVLTIAHHRHTSDLPE